MLRGRYPECYQECFAEILPDIQPGDMEIIGHSVDFLAVNVYDGRFITAKRDEKGAVIGADYVERPWGMATSTMGCCITPESIYYVSKFLYEEYRLPVYISENGIALADFLFSDGKVHDPARSEYLRLYIDALERAQKDGIEIDGYFYWSFLDNFEWSLGYTQRYGLVYVDFENGNRTPKDSFYEYKKIIAASRS
jgi:beta-glucosidase